MSRPVHVVVMGVSGTGKSTVGARLADALGQPFEEGDAHHPPGNVENMSAGIALTDEDRIPWLERLACLLGEAHARGTGLVLSCSALRRSYRDILRSTVPAGSVVFVHLRGDLRTLTDRMSHRRGHFMPSALLRSQMEALEPLEPDELGLDVDVASSVDDVVAAALEGVRRVTGSDGRGPG